ncbi:beta-1,4-mannosyl-glycoprotein 4-beta-N-acetylglucosaminyltransferase-like [Oppia nitens]|uniref:beta-1,4-mannosyl-glycoprotein 4-beta-N-acetylglucosaminyltransferase-like n=1 Tax=Oppia nitens TaxID=1686743 RepID=UPI0023DAB515|nr:beta-1,4-mannosyl-glycoprotein 4-beta-N-acetylglucosaminyltransferase-like [Oppia nitens]
MIAHYSSVDMNSSQLCSIHNWKKRSKEVKVIDAFIFSIELDLLEIRLNELWPYVDLFVVLESNKTFTGKSKRLYLRENMNRFLWAKDKLRYHSYNGLVDLKSGENPFFNENKMRLHMNVVIANYAKSGDIIIVSDVDEIPTPQAVHLVKQCTGFPQSMHLQLNTYLYSFEFFFSTDDSWRAHIQVYDYSFAYSHGRISDYMLADSGWHCSFCFRYLSDFIFKMTSYSHNDRVLDRKLLNINEIQRKICTGDDLYDMYPEVYTFREMIAKFGSIPKSKSMTRLPKHVIENREKFVFLLPDGCLREVYHQTNVF